MQPAAEADLGSGPPHKSTLPPARPPLREIFPLIWCTPLREHCAAATLVIWRTLWRRLAGLGGLAALKGGRWYSPLGIGTGDSGIGDFGIGDSGIEDSVTGNSYIIGHLWDGRLSILKGIGMTTYSTSLKGDGDGHLSILPAEDGDGMATSPFHQKWMEMGTSSSK